MTETPDTTSTNGSVRHDDPLLDHLTLDELETMLSEAEHAIHSIRLEMRERRAEIAMGKEDVSVDSMLPQKNLEEVRGRWAQFFDFVREITKSRHDGKAHGKIDLTEDELRSVGDTK